MPGHRPSAADLLQFAGNVVRSQYNVWIEHGQEPLEIADAHGGEKGIHNLPLLSNVNIGNRRSSPYSAASATRELPCRNW